MADWLISPSRGLRGEWAPPGDKSVSHRAVILGSLSEERTEVRNFLEADDCLRTVEIAMAIGAQIARVGDGHYIIHGPGAFTEPTGILDVGNSGTSLRLMAGLLAGQPFYSVLTGDASIRRRPMSRVVEPLRAMKAKIDGRNGGANAPLTIRGGKLKAIDHVSEVASAQVKSCVLLAGLFAKGVTSVTEPSQSRDHTERMLAGFGCKIKREGLTISVEGGQELQGQEVMVPGDISSAAFFLVAALLVSGSELLLTNVGVNPTRTGLLDALNAAGAELEIRDVRQAAGEPVADLFVTHKSLQAMRVNGKLIPRLVDEIPILAVAATQAHGTTVISDAEELRVKESDRIATVAGELRKMGAQIEEMPDGMVIHGPTPLYGADVESHHDHRVAMSLAVAALVADGETRIHNTGCVETSFPTFEAELRRLSSGMLI